MTPSAGRDDDIRELTAALDLAPVMVREPDGRIRFWGSGMRTLYGFPTAEALGRVSHELLHTEFPVPRAEIERQLAQTGQWHGELRHRRKNGGIVVVASLWAMHRTSADAPVVVEVNNDISERKQAEAAFREAHARTTEILESVGDGFFALDREWRFSYVNHQFGDIYGTAPAAMLGRTLTDVFPDKRGGAVEARLMQVMTDHRPRDFEAVSDTLGRWLSYRAWPGPAGGLSVFVRDIARHKEQEAALRDSEQRFHTLLESAPPMMWVEGSNGGLEHFNPTFRTYLDPSTTITAAALTEAIHPNERAEYLEAARHARERGQAYECEFRLRRHDGVWRWHLARIAPLRHGDLVGGWVGTATDIDDIRRMTEILEQRVQERTRQMAEANAELEAFAYSVAHDLRAPLRSMRGFSQALVEDYGDRLDDTGRDYADRIMSAADRLDTLIDDLLAYSRLAREEVRTEPVDLARLVEETLRQLGAAIEETHAEIIVDGALPRVMGQRSVLGQVLLNLVGNALKFVTPGTRPRVHVRAERLATSARISIEDNGIGFEPRHADRIFRLFERLHGSTSSYPGTGIGLAIVKKGIERLGGRVGAESSGGRGSRFWFELATVE